MSLGRAIAASTRALVTSRSQTIAVGEISPKRPLAIAAPICTDRMPIRINGIEAAVPADARVSLLDMLRETLHQLLVIEPLIFRRIHAIAQHRLATADPAKEPQRLGLAIERAEEDLLVIALQEPGVRTLQRQPAKPLDDLRRDAAAAART